MPLSIGVFQFRLQFVIVIYLCSSHFQGSLQTFDSILESRIISLAVNFGNYFVVSQVSGLLGSIIPGFILGYY